MVETQADMLLQGSYLRDVEKVLDAFKVVRRGAIRRGEIQVFVDGVTLNIYTKCDNNVFFCPGPRERRAVRARGRHVALLRHPFCAQLH